MFIFLFAKDANESTRGKEICKTSTGTKKRVFLDSLYSLFQGAAENVLFVHYRDSEEEVYFTTLQTLCILNHFLCQEMYQNLKSIFHRIMLLKINIVNHSEKAMSGGMGTSSFPFFITLVRSKLSTIQTVFSRSNKSLFYCRIFLHRLNFCLYFLVPYVNLFDL